MAARETRSKSYQIAALEEGTAFADAFGYRFDWSAGVALRLPPPFILGVAYDGQITAGIAEDGKLESPDPHVGGWSFTLGYAF